MRVLVATDAVGALSSAAAGRLVAQGWLGADVTVLPLGEAGSGFVTALTDRLDLAGSVAAAGEVLVSSGRSSEVGVVGVEGPRRADGVAYAVSSRPLGEAVGRLLAPGRPGRLYVDLAGSAAHDGGAGLLAALGATADGDLDGGVAGLGRLTRVDLTAAQAWLGETELVGVVPAGQRAQLLTGLRGITSLAARGSATAPALMLTTDAALEQFARLVLPARANEPGTGACGGLGLAVLALGGRLTTGPALALESAGQGPRSRRSVDLVVTGCSIFDFATRGGGVVAALAESAATALSPCIVIAGEVLIGAREMRTMGIDAAYAVRETSRDRPTGNVTAEELATTALRVARSWRW